MATTRQRHEPGGDDKDTYWLRDPFWRELGTKEVERLQRQALPRPKAEICESRLMLTTGRLDLDAAWRRYCDVIRELEMTAAELEALRNSRE